jgi:RNA polymerase sigma factor for flagellar operon FliA
VTGSSDPPEVLERFHAELELVNVLARQVARAVGRPEELDELVAYGRMGLLDAARRFDASRGVPFRAYASYRVRGAVLDGVRKQARLPRGLHQRLNALDAGRRHGEGLLEDVQVPPPPGSDRAQAEQALSDHLSGMATAMALGLVVEPVYENGEVGGRSQADDPEQALARAELVDLVERAVEELPEPERELVRRHYFGGERFDHVAAELGLSKSWASRLHTRAVGRLTKRLKQLG